MKVDELNKLHDQIFAPWIKQMGLKMVAIEENGARFHLKENDDLVHGGGIICGQALVSIVDTAAILTLTAMNDTFRPVTTVDLASHFVRPIKPGPVDVHITIHSNGKRMAFLHGDVRPHGADSIAMSATGSFMYL